MKLKKVMQAVSACKKDAGKNSYMACCKAKRLALPFSASLFCLSGCICHYTVKIEQSNEAKKGNASRLGLQKRRRQNFLYVLLQAETACITFFRFIVLLKWMRMPLYCKN